MEPDVVASSPMYLGVAWPPTKELGVAATTLGDPWVVGHPPVFTDFFFF